MSKLLGRLLLSVVIVTALFGGLVQAAPRAHAQDLCVLYNEVLNFPPGLFSYYPSSGGASIYDWMFTLTAGTALHYRVTADADVTYGVQVLIVHVVDPLSPSPGTALHAAISSDYPAEGTFVVPLDGTFLIEYMVFGESTAATTVQVSFTYECGSGEVVPLQSAVWGSCGLTDGRINADAGLDCAAPVAVYLQNGAIHVYGIDPATGQGVPSLVISYGQITSAGVPTEENLLLGEGILPNGQTVRVYRLTTGEFALFAANADGTPYVIVWATGAADVYHAE